MQITTINKRIIQSGAAAILLSGASVAYAWGDEGHEVVGLIAQHYLDSGVLTKVQQILATDDSGLVPDTDIAHEATWADKYRDSDRDGSKLHYDQTHNWHFVDLEIDAPDIDMACFDHPPIPTGQQASTGAAQDCVVDKINEFATELQSPDTPATERREALQFLLHFVGDLHQPLHSSDAHDAGGNQKNVSAKRFPAGNLHHYWDTEFVAVNGTDPLTVANTLIAAITANDVNLWSTGTPAMWAMESFQLAKIHAYGKLPAPSPSGSYRLSDAYVSDAGKVVALQLSRAGLRLANILNKSLTAADAR